MSAEPRVWILSRGRKGDLDQMLALAGALGWPHEVKTLSFRGPEIPVLSRLLLRNPPSPPWPDLVLCAEASPSVIAKDMRRKSGGRTKAVCLGRPAGAAKGFDLVITSAQYRIPAAPNVIELAMPLTPAPETLAPGASGGPIVLLVGGPAFPDVLDAAAASRIASEAVAYAERRNEILDVQTSPRTPPAAVAALQRLILPPHRLGIFGEGENRYRLALVEASQIIVTSDSVSMLSDALASGKPVSVFALPQARNLKLRLGEWFHRNAVEQPRSGLAPVRWLFDAGLIEAAPDRHRLHARLVAEGRLAWFGEPAPAPKPDAARRDLDKAVAALRSLMSAHS